MKHIKTMSPAEKAMRDTYPGVTDASAAQADSLNARLVSEVIDITRRADLLKLEASKRIGKLMGLMQGHPDLVSETGDLLATWTCGAAKSVVDWEALVAGENIPPATLKKYTVTKNAPRVFKIVDEAVIRLKGRRAPETIPASVMAAADAASSPESSESSPEEEV